MTTIGELGSRALLEQLLRAPGSADLTPRALEALVELGEARAFPRGAEILTEGRTAPGFFLMARGRAKMSRALPNGRSALIALLGPGDLFGTVAGLGGEPCDATVVALENAVCLEVERDALLALLERQPRLVGDLLPALTRPLMECRHCLAELTCQRVETRFAQLLLKLAESAGHGGGGDTGAFIPVRLSRQELADMTGTTIETAIRVMSRWGKEGLVETTAEGFRLLDRAALEELAWDRGETKFPENL